MLISKKILCSIISTVMMFTLIGCSEDTTSVDEPIEEYQNIEPISRTLFVMNTVLNLTMHDSNDSSIFDAIATRVAELDNLLSANKAGTEIDTINRNAGIEAVKVSDDTFNIISEGINYSEMSDGKFDISIGPLVKLWSIGFPEARVPSDEEINSVLPLIDYSSIVLDETNKTVFLPTEGMMLDLGAIAKGYAADLISDIFTENNVHSAIIDLGGNVFTHGTKVNGSDWVIGIQNPNSTRGEIVGKLSLANKSVVTSGVYERYLEEDGITYHHILNPENGYPYENNIAGISIISDLSIAGDALSTAVFAMGVEEGLEFVESLDSVDAIFITKDNEVYLTSGLVDNFEITDVNFTLVN